MPYNDASREATPPKTFKARQGRISELTASTIHALWPRWGVGPPPRPGQNPSAGVAPRVDLVDTFGADRPVVLEIGSGMGQATVAMAAAEPGIGLLAVEVHTRGVARLLRAVDTAALSNVRVAACDAVALLEQLPPESLAGIRAYFPDPWPKARHHKRRLVQRPFVALAASRLIPGGTLHLATDWEEYASAMLEALRSEPRLNNASKRRDGFLDRPEWRPVTNYERIGLAKGHTVRDLLFVRTSMRR
jgi:tRNA (guanine-N7-)-methyltransferase